MSARISIQAHEHFLFVESPLLSSRQKRIRDSSSDYVIFILYHQLSGLNRKFVLCHSFYGSGVGTQLGGFLCAGITGLQWKCHRTLMVPQTYILFQAPVVTGRFSFLSAVGLKPLLSCWLLPRGPIRPLFPSHVVLHRTLHNISAYSFHTKRLSLFHLRVFYTVA